MIPRSSVTRLQSSAFALFRAAGIAVSAAERERIEVADFGLGHADVEGAQILTLVQTNRYAAKVIALLPRQTLPEHWHPPVGDDPGKQETVRVAWGLLLVGTAGVATPGNAGIPPGKEDVYTCRRVTPYAPADSRTFEPGEKHWFQAGPQGAVVFSFSSVVRDALDGFSDPAIERVTRIVED